MASLVILLLLGIAIGLWRLRVARRADGHHAPRPRFLAPDDDPEFLRELDRRTRRGDDES